MGGTILTVGMGRKRKPKQTPAPTADKPVKVGTGLGSLIKAAIAEPSGAAPERQARVPPVPPASSAPRAAGSRRTGQSGQGSAEAPGPERSQADPADLRRLNDAYAGVTPMGRSRRRPGAGRPAAARDPAPTGPRGEDDAAARARLGALVGEGQRFTIERDEDGRVAGLRQGAQRALLRTLRGQKYQPEAELDLHGMRSREAATAVTRFVRQRHRTGARYLMIIHGAGTHSEGGVGVLAECTVEELTRGGAAPLVQAFATAHSRRGGLGALAVYLK